MNDKEKLVELLWEECKYDTYEEVADHLIANGVTIQKWISVEEALPDKNREAVLIALCWGQTDIGWYDKDDKCWQSEFVNSYDDYEVTHWMPLPEPPAEEVDKDV